MELGTYSIYGAKMFEIALAFLENLYTPTLEDEADY